MWWREAEDIADIRSIITGAHAILKAKGIIAATLERQGDEVNRLYAEFTRHKGELQKNLAIELTENLIHNLLRFREAVALGLENPTFEDQQRWLEV